ncbi:hypothetical protein GCM10009665_61430 [Kitasatospora nipponensis]|uniref:Uncharacterized protein n=1 Tax=Kitasatospora nipponensis TaxID=258049 RepID=A0ABN1WW61_9ACTN
MPQHHHTHAHRCTDCAGFASAAIATGLTLADGTRQTITVACLTCHGTGARPLTAAKTA